MASVNFTMRNQALAGGKFTGTLEVSGKDFLGNDYKHEENIEIDAKTDWDIPLGPCSVHVSVWLATPKQLCVDGHLQCGPARQPTKGPACFNV